MTARLPGFGPPPRRRLRNERAIDRLAIELRKAEHDDAWTNAAVTLARTTAAALDRLEHDPDRSEHVIGTVARVHAAVLDALRIPDDHDHDDDLAALAADLAAAVGNPPPA